jgi:UDP-glucose 4-epimerase
MRNVVVTGASNVLGRRVAEHLRDKEGVERIAGVETAASAEWIDGVELMSFGSDHRESIEFLRDNAIDTMIDCGLAPDPAGLTAAAAEARVIEIMRLGAAAGHAGVPVRAWVIASSSAVYPITSNAPLLQRENGETRSDEGSVSAWLLEAEAYARDVAERTPYLDVSVLRLQQLSGRDARGPLAELLTQPVLPSVIGFDPQLQLLELDDAVRALIFAAELELAGIYNVASSGVVRLSEAMRELERPTLPVLPIEAGGLTSLARRFGLPHVPDGLLDLMRFGHALDTSKIASAGFHPDFDQRACLASLRR